MADDGTYNGWTNRETWATNLWLDNDQGSQEYWREMAREAASISELEDLLEEHHEEAVSEAIGDSASWVSDMLTHAVRMVDWREIAKGIWEDAYEPNEVCSICGDVLDDGAENGRCEDCADVADPS